VLWKLGQKRIGQIQTDVWLVRGLATSFENVYQHFEARTLPERGLILSTGATLSHLMRPIRDYRLIPVKDILTEDALSPAINEDLLHRMLVGAPHETPAAQHPVQFDETEGRLTIATRDIPPWVIKGRLQAAVVRHLVTQLHHGQQWVPAHEILAKVYGAESVRRSKRISELFKGNARWQDYIEQDGNGQYGIKLE
jgi:hypothetical protein